MKSMIRCKFNIAQLLLGLFMFTIITVAIPQQALAFTLEVINDNNIQNTLEVAVRYYISNKNVWCTRGWYRVPPGETKRFAIGEQDNEEVDEQAVYVYAQRGSKEWWTVNEANGNEFIIGIVNAKAFAYYDGGEYPNGRKVGFGNLEMENGFYSVRFH